MEIEQIKKQLTDLKKQQKENEKNIRQMERDLHNKLKEEELKLYNPKLEDAIYQSGDYAGFTAGKFSFYYGYEAEAEHPLFINELNEECRKTWAFTVFKDGKEIYRRAIYAEHVKWNCLAGLLAGIGYWIEDKNKQKGI